MTATVDRATASARGRVATRRTTSSAGSNPDPNLRMRDWPWAGMTFALVTVTYFITIENSGRKILGQNALVVGFVAVAAVVVFLNTFTRSSSARAENTLGAIAAVTIAIPVARLPRTGLVLLSDVGALAFIGLITILGVAAFRPPRAWILLSAMFGVLAGTSLLSPDTGAIRVLALTLVAALPAFLLAGQLTLASVRRVSLVIVALGLFEAVLAMLEPFVFPTHLWAPAQIDSATGLKAPLLNDVLGHGYERSQGSMGHPLPLGLLLVLSIALVVRVVHVSVPHRVWMIAVLCAGLLFTDDRNSLILAAVVIVFFATPRLSATKMTLGIGAAIIGVLAAIIASVLSTTDLVELSTSGSYTHRLGAYESIGKLLYNQNFVHVVFGNGSGSNQRIFAEGLLQTDGFNAIDNEFVAMLSQGGLICAVLLVVITVLAIGKCPAELRPALLVVGATLLVFDSFQWPSVAVLTLFIYGVALSRAAGVERARTVEISPAEAIRRRRRARTVVG